MPIYFQSPENFVLTSGEVELLWRETIRHRTFSDEQVNIKVVDEHEIWQLNKTYRKKDKPTNVLVFSYSDEAPLRPSFLPAARLPGRQGRQARDVPQQRSEHDIALCLEVAEQEAQAQGVALRDYVALLLIHAFLHVTGMDHERSTEEAASTQQAEQILLKAAGFKPTSL